MDAGIGRNLKCVSIIKELSDCPFLSLNWVQLDGHASPLLSCKIFSAADFWSPELNLRLKIATAQARTRSRSHPLHKTIHYALLAGLVELNRQLVAVDGGDVAVAEFLVEDAVAEGEGGDGAGRLGDELAFDGQRQAAGAGTGTARALA
jgi:hypothetical protein